MIEITKLILENFQSHKYTVLNFESGMNTIVGPTDSGKSSIFRAIKWVFYNEPQGDYFIREGEDSCSVKVFFNNKTSIKRYRNKKSNGYEISYPDGRIETFEGFGRNIPAEVTNAINIKKINFTQTKDNPINLAEQLDGAFLLSENSSTKAQAIGKLVGADIVDFALSEVNADLRNVNSKIKENEAEISSLETELSKFDYLADFEKTIKKIEFLNEKIDANLEKKSNLEDIYKKFLENKKNISDVYFIVDSFKEIEKVECIYINLSGEISQYNSLMRLNDRFELNLRSQKQYETVLLKFKNISELEENIGEIDLKYKNLNKLDNLNTQFKNLMSRKNRLLYIEKSLNDLDIAEDSSTLLEEKIFSYKKLKDIFEKLNILKKRIANGENYTQKFDSIEDADIILNNFEKNILKFEKLMDISKKLSSLKEDMKRENKKFMDFGNDIDLYYSRYKDLLMKEGICPTCFRPIDKENIDEIIEHLSE